MMALTEDKQRPEWTLETGERRGQFRERGKLNDSRARDGDDLGEEKTKIGLADVAKPNNCQRQFQI